MRTRSTIFARKLVPQLIVFLDNLLPVNVLQIVLHIIKLSYMLILQLLYVLRFVLELNSLILLRELVLLQLHVQTV